MEVGQLDNIVQKIKDAWLENVPSATVPYFKELEGSTKQRIHNDGMDSDGVQIGLKNSRKGSYSPGYARRKVKIVGEANLYPINLQLLGDLLGAFTTGTEGGKPTLKFQTENAANIAAYNEKNFKTDIYRPSRQQLDDANEVLEIGIREFLQDTIKNIIS